MTTSTHLWAIGYDEIGRADQVRDKITGLGWNLHYLLLADVAVVVAFGQILPRAVLDAPRRGSINVHASILPRYRGAAPIQWAIMRGERGTGITTFQMDEGMDTGPILLSAPMAIGLVSLLENIETTSLSSGEYSEHAMHAEDSPGPRRICARRVMGVGNKSSCVRKGPRRFPRQTSRRRRARRLRIGGTRLSPMWGISPAI